MEEKQRHFVLVHGAGHGAWCWYKVAALLKSAGHKVTALDMAASGENPRQAKDLHSFSDYYEPLMEFMMSLSPEERVVIVGHSMGGFSISAAMERFPEKISVGVFAAAFMPGLDLSSVTIREEDLNLATRLVRPMPLYKPAEQNIMITKEKYGSVRRVYIVCGQDNILKERIQRWMIEKNPADEVKVIADSDHMVNVCKSPELCSCLLEIAGKYF
ncbi:conserved hypothetical protein [Ricinus communis]|uniref:AB hydrolase-1 domain-containing protein n=1 Tax=Ricinus communis TaxID=3988 RepID=B9S8N2_RICCO|nr:conserved hypothetical protein [Ricinus communis]